MKRCRGRGNSTFLTALILAALSSPSAYAARAATTDLDQIELRESPQKNGKILDLLRKGTLVTSSNLPINGFYKVRIETGVVGYLPSDSLILEPIQSEDIQGVNPTGEEAVDLSEAPTPSEMIDPASRYKMKLRAYFGLSSLGMSDLTQLLGANILTWGWTGGGEFHINLGPRWTAVLRLERLSRSVLARDEKSLQMYQFSVTGLPIMMGPEWTFFRNNTTAVHLAILGGAIVQTELAAQALGLSAPNTTTVSTTALCSAFKLAASRSVHPRLSLYGESGYRYSKSPLAIPLISGNGSDVLKNTSTGTFIPLSLDLSGFWTSLGFTMSF